MAYADGDPFIRGAILSYQQANRMKDHWNAAAAPTNPQGGMLHSDSVTDILSHYGAAAAAWLELLQAGVDLTTDFTIADDIAIVFGDDNDVCIGYVNGTDLWEICDGGALGANIRISVNGTGLSFFGVAPVAQPAHIADATGAGDVVTRVNAIILALENLGLLST